MDILTGGNLSSILLVWSVRSTRRGGEDVVIEWMVVLLFKPAASITISEYMKIWCNIQVIIYQFSAVSKSMLPSLLGKDTQSYELTNILTDKMYYTVALLLK